MYELYIYSHPFSPPIELLQGKLSIMLEALMKTEKPSYEIFNELENHFGTANLMPEVFAMVYKKGWYGKDVLSRSARYLHRRLEKNGKV